MIRDYYISAFIFLFFLAVTVITVLHGRYIKSRNEKRERQLLLALAHDIRTPLTVIRGYTEGIMDGICDTEEKRQAYLMQIREKTLVMDALLSDLMLYAKATSGSMEPDTREIMVSEELSSYVSAMSVGAALRGAVVTFSDETSGDVRIMGDPRLLERVLDNVLENAIKYRRGSSCRVDLFLRADESEVTLGIRDDGKGIRAEELPHIFDNLYRGSEKDGAISGSGVGLWLVKFIIESHGGRVWAESVYSSGTCIYMSIKRCV